jgi:hypothetical protein
MKNNKSKNQAFTLLLVNLVMVCAVLNNLRAWRTFWPYLIEWKKRLKMDGLLVYYLIIKHLKATVTTQPQLAARVGGRLARGSGENIVCATTGLVAKAPWAINPRVFLLIEKDQRVAHLLNRVSSNTCV